MKTVAEVTGQQQDAGRGGAGGALLRTQEGSPWEVGGGGDSHSGGDGREVMLLEGRDPGPSRGKGVRAHVQGSGG